MGDRIIVLLVALRRNRPNKDVPIDYRYESHRKNKPIFFYWVHKPCRLYVSNIDVVSSSVLLSLIKAWKSAPAPPVEYSYNI